MEKHFIRQDHRIIDCPISRRQFIKYSRRAGLLGEAKGLTGGLISCSSNVSQAGTAETKILSSKPYHHTAGGFRKFRPTALLATAQP